ncbi:MAG TPA: AsmA-like C-terminal region-containing protein [Chitinophagaceae bacterium]
MKKALKYTGISLVTLLVLLFFLPFLFKDKVLATVKSEMNKSLKAEVEFKDLSLSFFTHFPKLTVALDDISIKGVDAFSKDTLLAAKSVEASLNLLSVISSDNMEIHGVYLESPRIHVLVNKEGVANWDIVKEDPSEEASSDTTSSLAMSLQKYAIKDGYIFYRDEQAGMQAEITGLDHEGSGNFTDDIFTLSTSTNAGEASFSYANIPYLVKAYTGIDADIEIDNNKSIYKFQNADLEVNNLKLVGSGFFQFVNDSTYDMDITFNAPSNDFKDILSLVPAIYKNDFKDIKTGGTASFKGFVKGRYSPQQLPAYDINLGVKDGFFQYPDLPQPVKNIQLAMRLANPDGVMDHAVVDISKGHLEMGGEPFDFRLVFKNPETVQYIDAVVKGKLDLANVGRFVKLAEGTKLSGLVNADAFAKGALSAVQQGSGAFSAGGFFDIRNLYYASKDFPQAIQNGTMKVTVENSGGVANNTQVNIAAGHIEVGKDPLDFTLQLSNPVTSVDFKGTAKGRFTLDNIKQFVELEAGTSISGLLNADLGFSGNKTAIDKKQYDAIQTNGTVSVSNVAYASKDYPTGVKINAASLLFNPKTITLSHMAGKYGATAFTASGVLSNLIGYIMEDGKLGGNVSVAADKVNLNELMGTDTTTTTATSSDPFLVPANIDLTLQAKADQVTYDKVTYSNMAGALLLKDEAVQLKNVQTEALGGAMAFNGSYSTRVDKKNPDITMSYDVKDLDIQKTFTAFNTVQKLMPIGHFLAGKLSSQMSMNGSLNGQMMPNLSSLTGNGNLLVLQGVLAKFAPLEKLASTLQINELKSITIKDIKSHIEFANGKVLVKPFNVKVKDIDMQIGGMHGFDQTMDYIIALKVPRKYLGAQGNALVNSLAAQAAGKGIPVTLGDVVDLNVKMMGSIANPTIKTDLKQAAGDATKELKQQAAAFVQQKADSAKNVVKDSIRAVKNQVVNDLRDEAVKQLFTRKDSTTSGSGLNDTKKKVEETVGNTINGLFKKKKKPAADTTAQQ